jgi:hypothetical protein
LEGEFGASANSFYLPRPGSAENRHVGKDTNMATTKPSMNVADIQRQMAQIRHDMHQEVQGAVHGARSLTDWKSLVRSYPWLSLSIAATVGYFVVPRRRKENPTVVAVAAHSPDFLANAEPGNKEERARFTGWSVLGTAFSLLSPIVVRAAQSYALTYFEQLLANHPLAPRRGNQEHGPANTASEPVRSSGPSGRLREFR